MQVQDHAKLVHLLTELRAEHRGLDTAISELASGFGCDDLQLTRLKKRKLLLKDRIAIIQHLMDPDVPA